MKSPSGINATLTRRINVALIGNPNSGKSTLFNALTGARQHVGNYSGVTVEKKEGRLKYNDYEMNIVDLPGTYSLTAYSMDELVARNFIIEEKPDVVIDVVDSSNLERNLYLAVQLMELNVPLVLAFNMSDVSEKQGVTIDKDKLSKLLGVPIVSTVATKKQGINELLDAVIKVVEGQDILKRPTEIFDNEILEELRNIENILIKDKILVKKYSPRWLAIKLLEKDSEVLKNIKDFTCYDEVNKQVEKSIKRLQDIYEDTPETIIAMKRYEFISKVCSASLKKVNNEHYTISDKIDKILINRVMGLPFFLLIMWLVFKFTFEFSEPLMGWIEIGQEWLGSFVGGFLREGSALQSLIVDGIIGGVGSVFVFVPIIFLLFLAIAFLEDTGYMARAAFIMDKPMHRIGLHGRSFIPMILGFGCNLPAVMATRAIENKKDRLVTILVIPFMSCGARLPVYALFIGAFFPEKIAGNVLFSLYLLGVMVAIIMAKIFRKSLLKGSYTPFIMELPPYRMPTIKDLIVHMWERGVLYLKKAGTIIFLGCVFIWFLSNFPWNSGYSKNYNVLIEQAKIQNNEQVVNNLINERNFEKLEKSYAGRLGKIVAPIFEPLGFGDWKISVGLITGFVAKELVVGTLGTLYSLGEIDEESESLRKALQEESRSDGSNMYSPLVAYALMVFVLLYIPCIATIAVIKRETNSWRWPIFTAFYTTTVAWIVAFIVYQGGKLLGL